METLNAQDVLLQVMDHQRRGDNWEAMKHLKELAQSFPENAYYQKMLANTYFHMGLLDWAIDYYVKAIEVDNDYLDARYDLGVAYYHRGCVNQAIAEYQMVLELDSNYHAAHYRIGICYHHANEFEKAIHHLVESTVITPEYVMAHYHLGVIYYKQGIYEKAEAEFNRVLEENPEDNASRKYLDLLASDA